MKKGAGKILSRKVLYIIYREVLSFFGAYTG
jgi:hypothetical protein